MLSWIFFISACVVYVCALERIDEKMECVAARSTPAAQAPKPDAAMPTE